MQYLSLDSVFMLDMALKQDKIRCKISQQNLEQTIILLFFNTAGMDQKNISLIFLAALNKKIAATLTPHLSALFL